MDCCRNAIPFHLLFYEKVTFFVTEQRQLRALRKTAGGKLPPGIYL
jgi:hypothetical protein